MSFFKCSNSLFPIYKIWNVGFHISKSSFFIFQCCSFQIFKFNISTCQMYHLPFVKFPISKCQIPNSKSFFSSQILQQQKQITICLTNRCTYLPKVSEFQILRYKKCYFQGSPIFVLYSLKYFGDKYGVRGSRFGRCFGSSRNHPKGIAIDQESLISHFGII